jgi:hypothetical protein
MGCHDAPKQWACHCKGVEAAELSRQLPRHDALLTNHGCQCNFLTRDMTMEGASVALQLPGTIGRHRLHSCVLTDLGDFWPSLFQGGV